MRDTKETISLKIAKLKQRLEKLHLQEALSFLKESQKILDQDFSPGLALTVLQQSWTMASEQTRKEWRKLERPFRTPHPASAGKKNHPSEPTHPEA